MRTLRIPFLFAVLAGVATAQGTLTLSAVPHPNSFDGLSTAACAPAAVTCFDELVKTEPLTITLTTTPSVVTPPPAILQPRRLAVWLGAEFAPGFPIGTFFPGLTSPNLVYLHPGLGTPGGVIFPTPIVDSFGDPFGPFFGPPLSGPTNAYATTLAFNLPSPAFFLPSNGAPLVLVLQALADDTAGSSTPLLLSNALELNFVDPEFAHAPTATAIDPPGADVAVHPFAGRVFTDFSGPLGLLRSEGSIFGGDVLVVDGTNFLAQSDWPTRPPIATLTSRDDPANAFSTTSVQILSPTRLSITTPALPILAPPQTHAGYYDVSIRNDPFISPTAAPHTAPEAYLVRTGAAPVVTSFTVASGAPSTCGGPNHASPEGGDTLTIFGSHLLVRSTIRFTHLTNGTPTPGLAPFRVCPPASAYASGTQIVLSTPPFRVGDVLLEVIGPDEAIGVAPTPLVYCELKPTLVNPTPTFVPTPATTTAFPFVRDTGSNLALGATNVVPPTSPLFAATFAATLPGPVPPAVATSPACTGSIGPTVVPGTVAPTRYEITGQGIPTPLVLTPTYAGAALTNLAFATIDDEDDVRPMLGLKTLRAINPPCVATAGVELPSDPVAILVQDDEAPTISSLSTNVIPASTGSCPGAPGGFPYAIEITGANFFATDATKTALFSSALGPDFASFPAPAVKFSPVGPGLPAWCERVDVLSTTLLRATTPPNLATGAYVVEVMNPDGRFAAAPVQVRIVPPLTNPCALTDLVVPDLDAAALLAAADAATSRFVLAGLPSNVFSIAPMANPTKFLDHCEEQGNGSVPPAIAGLGPAAYDLCFVFNTRRRGVGGLREFDFVNVDLPAVVTLPAAVTVIGLDGAPLLLAPGPRRVIVKAAAFDFDLNAAKFRWFYEDNYPFVLRAKRTLKSAALVDLSGDALMEESGFFGGAANSYRTRHDWNPPPAGGGVGGRGGGYYCSQPFGSTPGTNVGWASSFAASFPSSSAGCLYPPLPPGSPPGAGASVEQWGLDVYAPTGLAPGVALPPIIAALPPGNSALGVSVTSLEGAPGFPPQIRFDTAALPLVTYPPPYGGKPLSGGRGGLGRAPTGGQGGGGAGGGGATAGVSGTPGTTRVVQAGGVATGAATDYPPGSLPILGRPSTDAYIYGGTTAADQPDFLGVFGAGYSPPSTLSGSTAGQFPAPLFGGGSGGGGGGGSVAVFVPCVSIGGRGGNGGGSVVFVSDGVIAFEPFGRVLLDGEDGRRGLDAFPIPNQDPLFVLCAPGNGGGGSGGTFFAVAISDVAVPTPTYAPCVGSNACLLPCAPAPILVGARGGFGGAAQAGVTPTAPGGAGGAGRMRFLVNEHSSRRAAVEMSLTALAAAGYFSTTTTNTTPILPVFPPPTSGGLSPFFAYPSP